MYYNLMGEDLVLDNYLDEKLQIYIALKFPMNASKLIGSMICTQSTVVGYITKITMLPIEEVKNLTDEPIHRIEEITQNDIDFYYMVDIVVFGLPKLKTLSLKKVLQERPHLVYDMKFYEFISRELNMLEKVQKRKMLLKTFLEEVNTDLLFVMYKDKIVYSSYIEVYKHMQLKKELKNDFGDVTYLWEARKEVDIAINAILEKI